MDIVKIGTCDKKTYLVVVPPKTTTAEVEQEVGYRLGLEASSDGYEICLISRSTVLDLGLLAWSIFEEVY